MGALETTTIIHPTTNTGDGITISSPATTVTVEDLEVTGADHGLNVSGITTLTLADLVLTGNTSGGTISDVTTVNETPSSGSTPTNVTVSGSSFVSDTNQAISLSGITNFIVTGGSGSDTFNVTPSTTTTFTIHGNLPTPPASPGDTLIVPSGGTLTDEMDTSSGYSGIWTFGGGDKLIAFDGIETLSPAIPPSTTYAVAEFPGVDVAPGESSVWLYTNTGVAATTGWSQLQDPTGVTVAPTLLAVDANGNVVAEFPGSGASAGVWQITARRRFLDTFDVAEHGRRRQRLPAGDRRRPRVRRLRGLRPR